MAIVDAYSYKIHLIGSGEINFATVDEPCVIIFISIVFLSPRSVYSHHKMKNLNLNSLMVWLVRGRWLICVCACVRAVIPQHGVDSGPLGGNNGEDLKPAMYYERLKILRQRKGLENHTKVSTAWFMRSYWAFFIDIKTSEVWLQSNHRLYLHAFQTWVFIYIFIRAFSRRFHPKRHFVYNTSTC